MSLPAIILSSFISLSSCDAAREQFIIDFYEENLHQKIGMQLPYKADTFEDRGSLVCASRKDGEQFLVDYSYTEDLEAFWIFFPEYSLWLNTTYDPQPKHVSADGNYEKIVKKFSGTKGYYHTHQYSNPDGPSSVVKSPSGMDKHVAYDLRRRNITFFVASPVGITEYMPSRAKLITPEGTQPLFDETFTPYILKKDSY